MCNIDTLNKKRSAIMPDLNSHINFVTNNSNSNLINLTKDTYLPTLNKEDSKVLCKQAGDRCKLFLLIQYFCFHFYSF